MDIDQCKEKANIKEISNRLHSVGKNSRNGSSVDSGSSKSQSVASNSVGRAPHSDTSGNRRINGNLVRDNLVKRNNMPLSSSNRNNNLLRTSPNMAATDLKKHSSEKVPQGRAINSSHQAPKYNTGTNPRLFNTQKYNRSVSKSEEKDSVRSDGSGKKELTKE